MIWFYCIRIYIDGRNVTISDESVDCFALLNNNVTIGCTYQGSLSQELLGTLDQLVESIRLQLLSILF